MFNDVPRSIRLDLNFKSGKTKGDDIILQLSVRFNEQIIIRNTYQQGAWGECEQDDHLVDSSVKNLMVAGLQILIQHYLTACYKFAFPSFQVKCSDFIF